jgi:hypothetical protein
MIFEKIDKLLKYYLGKDISKDEILEFQKQFEVIFSSFRDELKNEVGIHNYEILDSIFMAFDSYEPNEEIRKTDKYCIDEYSLITKIKNEYESIVRI